MSSVSKKGQKPDSKSSKSQLMEPPESLFPSKGEILRVIDVLAIASSVAFTCNFIATYFNSTTKPFCDSNTDSLDSLSDCNPCPRNGEGKLECTHGYRKHRNICREDEDVNERAKKLVCSKNLVPYVRVGRKLPM